MSEEDSEVELCRRRPKQGVRGAKRASDGLLLLGEPACADELSPRRNVRPASTTVTGRAERRKRAFRSVRLTMKLSCEPEPTSTVASPPRAGGEARQLQRLLGRAPRPGRSDFGPAYLNRMREIAGLSCCLTADARRREGSRGYARYWQLSPGSPKSWHAESKPAEGGSSHVTEHSVPSVL